MRVERLEAPRRATKKATAKAGVPRKAAAGTGAARKAAATRSAAKKAGGRKAAVAAPGNVVRVSIERGASAHGLAPSVLKKRVERMLDALDLRSVEVSVALVGDETIRTLNREWRKKDKATDVLSFPMMDDAAVGVSGASPAGGGPTLLGDVIVSTPTATRQAREHQVSLAHEVTVLLAHGVLHLLGFDHDGDDEEREMDAYARVLEAAAVSALPMRLKLVPVRPR